MYFPAYSIPVLTMDNDERLMEIFSLVTNLVLTRTPLGIKR